jgi:hypothetical protein
MLTPTHQTRRLAFVEDRKDQNDPMHFDPQYDTIHIDEKWFYVDKVNRKCWVAEDEEEHYTQQRNKKFMDKVMFLAAVARPRKNTPDAINWDFDGKVGVYPFIEYNEAVRSSRNRERGELVMVPVNVNKELFQTYILDWLLPDIKLKCPAAMLESTIYIQMDNASPHNIDTKEIDIALFDAKCNELEIRCEIRRQPAQSPDTNICDLCFFPSIQALYFETLNIRTTEDIVAGVDEAF